eukprot:188644-Chlamydomonas_euryale.AAC.3
MTSKPLPPATSLCRNSSALCPLPCPPPTPPCHTHLQPRAQLPKRRLHLELLLDRRVCQLRAVALHLGSRAVCAVKPAVCRLDLVQLALETLKFGLALPQLRFERAHNALLLVALKHEVVQLGTRQQQLAPQHQQHGVVGQRRELRIRDGRSRCPGRHQSGVRA